jgi:hypothetical protein
MGRMKELCLQIMEANDGAIPGEMTISDVKRMEELQIFEWEYYEREQQRLRLQEIKLDTPRETTKVAKTEQFWEEELRREQQRQITQEYTKDK